MTGMEIGEKLEELSGKQGQAADALYLLLDGLEREGQMVTKGPLAAEDFSERLRMYMGALHLIADTLGDPGRGPWFGYRADHGEKQELCVLHAQNHQEEGRSPGIQEIRPMQK